MEEYFSWFPFELSAFQKESIVAIAEGNHSLVTAHTGSGKTVPGEFAIMYFVRHFRKKVIYLSPIKALSNQKYWDFSQKYPDISFGLLTGDLKINVLADVLIMTTEILMNYLSFGADKNDHATSKDDAEYFRIDLQNELAAVVVDEVHFINDASRGKNYEQMLFLLPAHVQLIMLSATLESPEKLAAWVETGRFSSSRRGGDDDDDADTVIPKKCIISSTTTRVVPLVHSIFYTLTEHFYKTACRAANGGGDGEPSVEETRRLEQETRALCNSFHVVAEHGIFRPAVYESFCRTVKKIDGAYHRCRTSTSRAETAYPSKEQTINTLLRKLRDEEMLPAIFFVFSRKGTQEFAQAVSTPVLEDDSKVPYTTERECESILRRSLPLTFRDYLRLEEYVQLVALLEKGVAYHHSGMLPVLREIVEFMISRGRVKVLFATESFAVGLDCPIKTAVFTSLTKYDGRQTRYLAPHEYNQMAGRAGRRGKDTDGHVVHAYNLFFRTSGHNADRDIVYPTYIYYNLLHTTAASGQRLVSRYTMSPHLLLKILLSLGSVSSLEEIISFVSRSMAWEDAQKEMISEQRAQKHLETQIAEKYQCFSNYHKTPIEVCREYTSLKKSLCQMNKKKRKDAERRLAQMETEYHPHLQKKDAAFFESILAAEEELESAKQTTKSIQDFFHTQVTTAALVLMELGFLENTTSDGTYSITPLRGQLAARMGEVPATMWVELILRRNWFSEESVSEIVAAISFFSDIGNGDSAAENGDLAATFEKEIASIRARFVDTAATMGCDLSGEDDWVVSTNPLPGHVARLAYDWAQNCPTEDDCLAFFSNPNTLAIHGISLGDFVKCMLKISAIARETRSCLETWLASVATRHENLLQTHEIPCLTFLAKLSQVDANILKNIVTMQSLYV